MGASNSSTWCPTQAQVLQSRADKAAEELADQTKREKRQQDVQKAQEERYKEQRARAAALNLQVTLLCLPALVVYFVFRTLYFVLR